MTKTKSQNKSQEKPPVSAAARKRFLCVDCSLDTMPGLSNYYMVTEELWEQYGAGQGMLCVGCFETRLGRPLRRRDFMLCYLNEIYLKQSGERHLP